MLASSKIIQSINRATCCLLFFSGLREGFGRLAFCFVTRLEASCPTIAMTVIKSAQWKKMKNWYLNGETGKKSLKSQFRVVKDKNRVFSAARSINFFFRVHHKTSINSKFGGLCLLLAFDGGSREFRVSRSADCAAASCFFARSASEKFLVTFFFRALLYHFTFGHRTGGVWARGRDYVKWELNAN